MSLQVIIVRMIAADGPMPLDRYMSLCLGHPEHGYYMKGEPVGARGAFTTAPEISQMFGEFLGAWCHAMWSAIGAPDMFHWVELGPGRGTLFADMLRTAKLDPAFQNAARVVLVESSPILQQSQRTRLKDSQIPIRWIETLDELPAGAPLIVVANEFFDALPIRQAVKGPHGWHERMVGISALASREGQTHEGTWEVKSSPTQWGKSREAGKGASGQNSVSRLAPLRLRRTPPNTLGGELEAENAMELAGTEICLAFGLSPHLLNAALIPEPLRDAPPNSIVEFSPARDAAMRALASRIEMQGGAALIVDYGFEGPKLGDTFQALRAHAIADPLQDAGDADLTAHVDFTALGKAAPRLATFGPVGQGEFLRRLGLSQRAERLKRDASPQSADGIDAAVHRLSHPDAMGSLFKAFAICQENAGPPPGF